MRQASLKICSHSAGGSIFTSIALMFNLPSLPSLGGAAGMASGTIDQLSGGVNTRALAPSGVGKYFVTLGSTSSVLRLERSKRFNLAVGGCVDSSVGIYSAGASRKYTCIAGPACKSE